MKYETQGWRMGATAAQDALIGRAAGGRGEAVAVGPAVPVSRVLPVLALLALNLADVVTTHRIIGLGGREMNPVAGWLLHNGWLLGSKLALVAVVAALVFAAPPRRWVTPAVWVLASFYGAVIAWHTLLLAVH